MAFIIGRGFADCQVCKSENGPVARSVKNIVLRFCINIDIDKM